MAVKEIVKDPELRAALEKQTSPKLLSYYSGTAIFLEGKTTFLLI